VSQVQRHLTKLFDSMARLMFGKDKADNDTRVATGMWSKDEEYVDLFKHCDCSGQVSAAT